MKVPEKTMAHCPFCNTHTEHTVALNRKGEVRHNSKGTRKFREIKKGYGGMARTPKKPVFKFAKRVLLILKCKVCNKKHQKIYNRTTKTTEIVKVD
ncbi:MAG: hypothetical protein QMD06_04940 [Candidatus Altarchaeum sp.]|nr:hypothetical protein [Candidatus Altarchaeum sp.]